MKAQLRAVPAAGSGAAAKPATVAPHFLTVPEVAALLRCRPRTIYTMVSQRRIPFRKAGRLLRFEAGEIDAWTKDCAER
jgi:excisionase family DNA binding protein